MTTPAVNIDSYLDITGGLQSCNEAGGSCAAVQPKVAPYRYRKEVRPKSVTSKKGPDGWRAPTNFSHESISWTLHPSSVFVVNKSSHYSTWYLDNYGWSRSRIGIPALPVNLEGSAVNKALLKLKDEDINIGVAFFERKETGELAIDAMNRTVGLLKKLMKRHKIPWNQLRQLTARDLRSASQKRNAELRNQLNRRLGRTSNPLSKRNTKKLLNDFLQVQYGVRPLVADVHGSASAIEKSNSGGRAQRINVKASSRDDQNYVFSGCRLNNVAWHNVQVSVKHRVYVRLYYVLDSPVLATLSSLGITNPASWLWERIPFSFVIDWGLKVGDYVSAFDAALGWDFMSGTISRMTRVEGYSPIAMTAPSTSTTVITLHGAGAYSEKNYSFKRSVLTSSPWPRMPSLKNPFSGEHTSNAIALIAARLR